MTLQFAIWDTDDHVSDSTVILDDFRWSTEAVAEATTEVLPMPR